MSTGGPSFEPVGQPAARSTPTWAWLLLVAAAVFGYIGFRRLNLEPGRGAGNAARYDWKVTDLEGTAQTLESFKGRPVFLNVWATWCPPCVAEFPLIAKLASKPEHKDTAFVCVSVDEDLDSVRDFLKQNPDLPMTILHASEGPPPVYSTEGIPATFFITPGGRIARREVGMIQEADLPEVERLLQALKSE
jgi:thiol-disulfide isomerase/thioredoxin